VDVLNLVLDGLQNNHGLILKWVVKNDLKHFWSDIEVGG